MPPPPHTKPENVLKRAQELLGVGQPQSALTILHEHVTSKRTRSSPIASLEPVMLLFIELCVEQRKGKLAKDGLYNYKNTSQNTNVATIELVFRKFIELAEQKVSEAQAKAEEMAATNTETDAETTTPKGDADAIVNVGDLEATETPESIILATVSGEQSKDRTDRAIVTPWLKFLWETYRTILDVFKNNARLEVMYQTTAHQAFQFCSKYARKTEFRRLCELLRNHLQNAAKYSSQPHSIDLNDPDTLQRHLDTRFQQLNVAVELELWQEAFKSVEDTHTLLSLSKRPAKSSMMLNYFEKLTRIFLRSGNYLFHAAAWSRYYSLLRQTVAVQAARKEGSQTISDQDLTKAASFVVLSALAIPVISTSRSRGALVDSEETKKNKSSRLTNLLVMSQAPTRAILFKDALSKDLLRRVRPEIRQLYNILEVDFHPLSICRKIAPILSQIGANPELEKYVVPLQQVILTRLFQQLSQVYETVQLDFVLDLAQFPAPYEMSRITIEKFIMNGCKKGDLSIRIDHTTGVLTFDSDVFASSRPLLPGMPSTGVGNNVDTSSVQRLQSTPAEIVRTSLTRLAKTLYITCQYVDPSFNADQRKAQEVALKRAEAGAAKEHADTLTRRDVIEKKKMNLASALAAREREKATQQKIRARQLQEAEVQRLADEQKDREMKRLKAEQQRVQREEMQKQLDELKLGVKGLDFESLDLDDLDSGRIRAMKLAALEREKNEMGDKMRITGKRLDHLERAYRKEEINHLPADEKKQHEADRAAYDKKTAETITTAQQTHAENVEIKGRLSRLVSPYEIFKREVTQQRHAEFEKRRKAAEQELQQQIEKRKREHREAAIRERKQKEEAERQAVEDERRRQAEDEQREREEREEKERKEADRAERAKQREESMAAAAKQREREEEAERKRLERKGQGVPAPMRPSAEPASASASEGERPRLALAGRTGGAPSWREREAMKAEGDSTAPTQNAAGDAAASAPRPGAYVPMGRRGDGAPPLESRDSGSGSVKDKVARWQSNGASTGEKPSSDRWQPSRPRGAEGDRAPGMTNGASADSRPPMRTAESGSRGPQAAPAPLASSGAYKPGAFRQRRDDGQGQGQ